jgi:hypothetical protein
MKRILSLIIMVLYLLPALGITVSTHYCSGKLADVSVFGSPSKMKCSCGAEIPKNKIHFKKKCCEQIVYSLKLGNQQLKQPVLTKSTDSEFLEEKQFVFDVIRTTIVVPGKVTLSYIPSLPPGRYKEPIYIQNDSFLL